MLNLTNYQYQIFCLFTLYKALGCETLAAVLLKELREELKNVKTH